MCHSVQSGLPSFSKWIYWYLQYIEHEVWKSNFLKFKQKNTQLSNRTFPYLHVPHN